MPLYDFIIMKSYFLKVFIFTYLTKDITYCIIVLMY